MSDPGNAPQAPDRKSLLSQQFDEVEQAVQTPAPEADKQQPQQPQTPALPVSANRARDEAGKFVAKKDGAPAEPLVAAPAAPAEPKPWERAPKSWKKDHWENWNGLPEPVRQYIHTREDQMRAGSEPLLPKAELADKITQAAEPYMNTIRGLGMDLPTAVSGLMRVDHDLRTMPPEQKLQRLIGIAQSYGIDLTGQAQNAQQMPQHAALQNDVLTLKGRLNALAEAQEAAQQRGWLDEITKFSATAEHYEDAKPTMVQLLHNGMADSLSDAYEKAIRLDPDLFAKVQSAKQAAADAEKSKAADAAAKRAKMAAVSVKGATPGTSKPTNAQDRRSMLREQLDSLSERL